MQPDAYGSAVELRVVGDASGGNPSNNRTVEVGAVEWNAKLDASSASLSELYFLRARYYDPVTGRFLGRDPVEFAQRYAYAGNNLVLLVDPSGLNPFVDFFEAAVTCVGGLLSGSLDPAACAGRAEELRQGIDRDVQRFRRASLDFARKTANTPAAATRGLDTALRYQGEAMQREAEVRKAARGEFAVLGPHLDCIANIAGVTVTYLAVTALDGYPAARLMASAQLEAVAVSCVFIE